MIKILGIILGMLFLGLVVDLGFFGCSGFRYGIGWLFFFIEVYEVDIRGVRGSEEGRRRLLVVIW